MLKNGAHTLSALSLPDKTVAPIRAVRSTVLSTRSSRRQPVDGVSVQSGGRTTIYVQPCTPTGTIYPFVPRGTMCLTSPWSPDGNELFYNPRAGGFEVVAVTTEPEFGFGNPIALPRPFRLTPPQGRRSYDVTRDGRIVAVFVPEDVMNRRRARPRAGAQLA